MLCYDDSIPLLRLTTPKGPPTVFLQRNKAAPAVLTDLWGLSGPITT